MGSSMKDSEGVGKVIGRLMMIDDILAVTPSSISLCAKNSLKQVMVKVR